VISHLHRVPTITPIEWFPDDMAWRCPHDVYHNSDNAEFKTWIQETNASGGLTFQEEVRFIQHLRIASCRTRVSQTHDVRRG
jgi:hypothetical protein